MEELDTMITASIIITGIVLLFGQFSSCEENSNNNRTKLKAEMIKDGKYPLESICFECPISESCKFYLVTKQD